MQQSQWLREKTSESPLAAMTSEERLVADYAVSSVTTGPHLMWFRRKELHHKGYRSEVDQEKLGPALVITAGLILGMRTIRWEATHSDGLAGEEWEKEVEHSARVVKRMLTFLTTRYPDLFQSKKVPWYVATDDDCPQ